jgi:hypothetical protein
MEMVTFMAHQNVCRLSSVVNVSTNRLSGDYRCVTLLLPSTALRCSTFHLIYITMHVNDASDVFPAVVSRRTTLAWLPPHFTEE